MTISLAEVCYSSGKFCCSEYLALTHHVLQDLPWTNWRLTALGTMRLMATRVNAAQCFTPYCVHALTARIRPTSSDVTCLPLMSAHF